MNPLHPRQLRRDSTPAEKLLWRFLRNRRLRGHKFRRQHPIGPFIVDFCCLSAHLIAEVDGGHHAATQWKDQQRSQWLHAQGYRVIRFWNHEVLSNPAGVLEYLGQCLDSCGRGASAPPLPASPPWGEGAASPP
ncbi:MAG: endonuclease domain-containing protein [Myxococcales bacterium]|nr:endonuclease domain-containing protein [Myxococcales bacterium]